MWGSWFCRCVATVADENTNLLTPVLLSRMKQHKPSTSGSTFISLHYLRHTMNSNMSFSF